jgi:Protein of unknown function (DUF664)
MGTSPEPDPPLFPDELVATAGERAVLETFLELYRDAIVRKVRGISDDDARRRLVGSATTLGGIVKHLHWVELEPSMTRLAPCPGPRPRRSPWTTPPRIPGWARSPSDGSMST